MSTPDLLASLTRLLAEADARAEATAKANADLVAFYTPVLNSFGKDPLIVAPIALALTGAGLTATSARSIATRLHEVAALWRAAQAPSTLAAVAAPSTPAPRRERPLRGQRRRSLDS
jgi:hypothetical protein